MESESLAVSSTPHCQDSSPGDQNLSENPSERFRSRQDQGQEQEREEPRDRTRRKRKRGDECRETSVVETSPAGGYSGEGYKTPKMNSSPESTDSEDDVEEVRNPRCCRDPPAAPRKPKAAPAKNRRAMWCRSSLVLLDVSREVESMFPPSVLQDFCKKIRKTMS